MNIPSSTTNTRQSITPAVISQDKNVHSAVTQKQTPKVISGNTKHGCSVM